MTEKKNAYIILVGKPEGNTTLRRPRRRWYGTISKYLRETGWEVLGCSHLTQDRDQ